MTLDGANGTLQYPFAEVVEEFQSAYLQNGVAYMIAFALLCKAKKISLYGCDFDFRTPGSMYEAGRSCVEYWLGRAHALGVATILPNKCNLLDLVKIGEMGLYGFGFEQPVFEQKNGKILLKGFNKIPKQFMK